MKTKVKTYFVGFLLVLALVLAGCQDDIEIFGKGIDMTQPEGEENLANNEIEVEKSNNNQPEDNQKDEPLVIDEGLAIEYQVPILMFHYIEDVPADTDDQTRYKLSYSPERLSQLLDSMISNNITAISFKDLVRISQGKKEMPAKAAILTFDDGYLNQYTEAYRILQEKQMSGVFFVISSKPDNDGIYADWKQIKEMADNGMEIGSHTVNHLNLAEQDESTINAELSESIEMIEKKIGQEVITLCYPAGKYDDRVEEIAAEYYLFARTTNPGSEIDWQNRYELPTVRMFPDTTPEILNYYF